MLSGIENDILNLSKMDLFRQEQEDRPYSSKMAASFLENVVSLCDNTYCELTWKENDTLLYVLSKIDNSKLIERVWCAMNNPDKEVKVVLMEYNYTRKQDVPAIPNVCDRLPSSGVLVHDAMYRPEFVELMNKHFRLNDKIKWYRRRRVNKNGTLDNHRWQVVLKFEKGALEYYEDYESTSISSVEGTLRVILSGRGQQGATRSIHQNIEEALG